MSDVHERLKSPLVTLTRRGAFACAAGEGEKAAVRVFYVAATWATQKLVMGVGGAVALGQRWGS